MKQYKDNVITPIQYIRMKKLKQNKKRRNKRGQGTIMLSILFAGMFFIFGMLLINFIRPEITDARAVDSLDCTNSSISDGTKLTCLGVDIALPYFIVIVLSVAGGVITSKLII